ncbi:hypothetical protein AVEN_48810-1 [Araneus ventricosus]|uniref:Uncharacterized protein n=1 Tax=Araneus ventricosus TaxID=182803 RepID=A0A4Y2IG92_ARAVE|nr:hypothetical protein AVEN_48810-1 [Araneus ventricosus]
MSGLTLAPPHNLPSWEKNGPYAQFVFESIEKQLWRNKQNDRPISDSEIKAVLSQLFKTDQWLQPAGHVSEKWTRRPVRVSIGDFSGKGIADFSGSFAEGVGDGVSTPGESSLLSEELTLSNKRKMSWFKSQ